MHLCWQPRSACPGLTELSGWGFILHLQDVLAGISNTLLSWLVSQMWTWHSGLTFIIILLFNFDLFNNFSSRNLLSESLWVEKSWTWAVLGRQFPQSGLEGQGKSWLLGFQWEDAGLPTPWRSFRPQPPIYGWEGPRAVSPLWIMYLRKRNGLIYNRRKGVPVKSDSLGLLVEGKGKLDHFLLARLWNI